MTKARTLADMISDGVIGTTELADDVITPVKLDETGNYSMAQLGIGTTSPNTLLELSSADPILRFNDSNGGTDTKNFELRHVGTNSPDIDGLYFRTVNDANTVYSDKMVILGNGNVGIGENSPQGRLHLKKTDTGNSPQNPAGNQLVIENGDSSGSADIQFLSASNGYNHIFFGDANDANIGVLLYDHTNNSMQFQVNASERMRIDSSGRVGIGTSTPSEQLTNYHATNSKILASTGANGASQIYFGDNSSDLVGRIYYDHTADSMRFHVNTDERMRIDSSGNVAIGVAAPAQLLHVQAGATGNGTIRVGGGAGLEISHDNSSNTVQRIDSLYRTTSADANLQLRTGTLTFHTGTSSTERMRINADGEVGIGTSDATDFPGAVLHVHKNSDDGGDGDGLVNFGDEASVVISTNATLAGGQGYLGSLWFGSQDIGSVNQYNWNVAGIASTSGTLDTGTNAASGNLEFYTKAGTGASAKAMEIDTNGRITTPYQPAFYAHRTTSYTLASGSGDTFLSTNSATVNRGNHYSTSTGRFTAPIAGVYKFDVHLSCYTTQSSSLGSQDDSMNLTLAINGNDLGRNAGGRSLMFNAGMQSANGVELGVSFSAILNLNAGDYVQPEMTDVSVPMVVTNTNFCGYLLG